MNKSLAILVFVLFGYVIGISVYCAFLSNRLEISQANLEKASEQYIESHICYEQLWKKYIGWDTANATIIKSRDKSYFGVPKEVHEFLQEINAKGDSAFIGSIYFWDADMLLGVRDTYLTKMKLAYKLWKSKYK